MAAKEEHMLGILRINHHGMTQIVLLPIDFREVGRGKECSGTEQWAGWMPSLAVCADRCRGFTDMFVFGTNKNNKCKNDKCKCYCETASKGQECTSGYKNDPGYNLYAFTTPGMKKITLIIMISALNDIYYTYCDISYNYCHHYHRHY